jgi:hypothetical protein
MGAPFRPASRVVPGSYWTAMNAQFRLDGLDRADVAAVLRQWATAPHLRGEIARVTRSAQGFARTYGASVNHLRNMLNGHRLPDYPTLALVLTVVGHSRAPSEEAISDAITKALKRSTPNQPGRVKNYEGIFAADLFGWEPTGPTGPGTPQDVPDNHPDARLIRSVFTRAVLANSLVTDYLSADHPRHPDDPDGLSVELTVQVAANIDEVSAEGFITSSLIAGSIRVPEGWKNSVYDRCGGLLGGEFVAAAVENGRTGIMQFIGAQVYVEAGESHLHWDLAFIDKKASLGEDGSVTWRG